MACSHTVCLIEVSRSRPVRHQAQTPVPREWIDVESRTAELVTRLLALISEANRASFEKLGILLSRKRKRQVEIDLAAPNLTRR